MGFANLEGGMAMSLGPLDICLVPTPVGPIPTPFENLGEFPMAIGEVPTVLLSGMPACCMASMIEMTEGDEPGCNGGVASGVFMEMVEFIVADFLVLFGGIPGLAQGITMTIQNLSNAPGDYTVPSQFLVEPA